VAKKKPKRIMVVDDDPHVILFLRDLFADAGYEVAIATSAEEAKETVRRIRPDLITLDIVMPGSWGPRFAQFLTRDPELTSIPLIVVSGMPSAREVIPCASAWLAKPADPETLLGAVRQLIG
jgi:CheY-like chemotaxis protein